MNATLRTILREAGIAIGLTIAVGLVGYEVFGSRLSEARHAANLANDELTSRIKSEQYAWIVANESVKIAGAARLEADKAATAAAGSQRALKTANEQLKALGPAPDTCTKWVNGAIGARDLANETAQHWKDAFEEQQKATAKLQQAIDTVKAADDSLVPAATTAVKASETLVKASGFSFGKLLGLLRPKINVNAVTIDATKHIGGPSIGLGWQIPI